MSLVELTQTIVSSLVRDPSSISIKEFDSDEEIVIEVIVSNDEIGYVVGKEGKIANSIRTIVQASAYLNNNNKRVRININSI